MRSIATIGGPVVIGIALIAGALQLTGQSNAAAQPMLPSEESCVTDASLCPLAQQNTPQNIAITPQAPNTGTQEIAPPASVPTTASAAASKPPTSIRKPATTPAPVQPDVQTPVQPTTGGSTTSVPNTNVAGQTPVVSTTTSSSQPGTTSPATSGKPNDTSSSDMQKNTQTQYGSSDYWQRWLQQMFRD